MDDPNPLHTAYSERSPAIWPQASGGLPVGGRENYLFINEVLKDEEEVLEAEGDWAAELQHRVKAKGISPISFLPVLGQEGYIRVNRSHILAAYPKGGKTELLVNILLGWENESILYISEEGQETWEDRLYELPDWPNEMRVEYALGKPLQWIAAKAAAWTGSVVVIDTIKLLGIQDENSTSQAQGTLAPFITACRQRKQTLVFCHHDNKHGGTGGRGIAGSHAFLGVVDIFLEIDEVPHQPNQRVLSGRGRIRRIDNLLYEKQDDGLFKALGNIVIQTELTIQAAVTKEWLTTNEIAARCGLNAQTTIRHLKQMADKGLLDREAEGQGKTTRWRKF